MFYRVLGRKFAINPRRKLCARSIISEEVDKFGAVGDEWWARIPVQDFTR